MLTCILLRKDNPFSYKIEDKVTTDKRKEASTKVEDQYTYKSEYKQNKVDIVNDVFAKVDEVVQEIKAVGSDDQKDD